MLASVGSVALTWWLGLLLFKSRRSALYGACALLGCRLFLNHSATTDAVLAFFVLTSFCGFASALVTGARWGLLLAWLGMGAAMLQKGPVLGGHPARNGVCVDASGGTPVGRKVEAGLFARRVPSFSLAVVLPWPILLFNRLSEGQVVPAMAHELTIHLLQRPWEMFTGFGVTLARLFNGMLPWSLLGLYYRRQDARDPYTTLLSIWGLGFATLFGLFMVLQRSRYLVPLTPPLAILCGHALSELQSDLDAGSSPGRLFTSVLDLSFVGLALYCATLAAAGVLVIKTSAPVVVGAAASDGPGVACRRTVPSAARAPGNRMGSGGCHRPRGRCRR